MRSRRLLIARVLLIAATVAVVVLITKCGRPSPDDPLALYGNVDIRQVELGFRIPGRIEELAFDEGQRVRKGELLARLDPQLQEDALRAAQAEVAAGEAQLAALLAGSRPAEIERARAAVAEVRAGVANAKKRQNRNASLLQRGAIAQASYDESTDALDQARARLASAQRSLQLAEEGPRQEEIDAASARVEIARAHRAASETALEDTRLLAPSDGIVISRVRERGAIISPANTVFVLSLVEPVWVRAFVTEPELGRIHPGMEVEVLTDSAPGRPYRGRVGFISPVAEFTPKSVQTEALRTDLVYRLRIVVEDADEGLRQGMPVTVRVPHVTRAQP